jgi:hypothetical protein
MVDMLGPELSPITFVVLHDRPLVSKGYNGVTNARRYSNIDLLAL